MWHGAVITEQKRKMLAHVDQPMLVGAMLVEHWNTATTSRFIVLVCDSYYLTQSRLIMDPQTLEQRSAKRVHRAHKLNI